jgi:hypothetical protein
MTQPDEWKSPYDPPAQPSTPEPGSGPAPGPEPAPGQAGPPSPYQQPYEQPYQQPYAQGPAPYQTEQQGQPYQAQPGPYGTPYGYTAPPEKNAVGVWSLVLGIVGLALLFSCGIGFLAGIPAVITGHLSRKAQKEGLANNGGMGLAGIIMGWVTIGLTVLAVAGLGVLFSIPEFREGFFSDTGYEY